MGAQQDLCEIGGVCGFDALAQMEAVEWRLGLEEEVVGVHGLG